MRPLPLADPLRMIITSRRLNFALLRPYPHPYPRCPEGSTPQRTASFIPFITSAAPAAYLYCRPYRPPLPSLLDYSERPLPHPPTLTPNWLKYQSMRHSGWPCWNFRKLTIHSLEMVIWKAGKAVATTLQRIWAKGYRQWTMDDKTV